MGLAPEIAELPQTQEAATEADLRLLVPLDSRLQTFIQNFADLFRKNERGDFNDDAAPFWSDVFVAHSLPWMRFLQSGLYHILALAVIWIASRFPLVQPHALLPPSSHPVEVVYYSNSDYLPPVDTRRRTSASAKKASPEHSAQPVISLPPQAESHLQTVVTPPKVKLREDLALRNMVAWREKTQVPIAPAPVLVASEISRVQPHVAQAVVAPPPDLVQRARISPQDILTNPQPVIAPPPEADLKGAGRTGNLDIGRSAVIAPAPQLSLDQQHINRSSRQLGARSAQVIAPPPALVSSGQSPTNTRIIALNLHPAVGAPDKPVVGNRRGSFATTPDGHRGASGAAGENGATGSASSSGSKARGDLPPGLYVGKTTNNAAKGSSDHPETATTPLVNPNLRAEARPPRVSARTMQPDSAAKLSEEERAVFGNRKFYSLSLNMPNLNSAGGSWIIRFAALGESGSADVYARETLPSSSSDPGRGELSAPSALRKVDPAYPLELMRQNVGGTVILYAVIHSDGTVGDVRVLRSVDDRLDRYASQAVAKWRFEPATKNGKPVDVEATFWIPFKPARANPGF